MDASNSFIHADRLALRPETSSIRPAGQWLRKICADAGVPVSTIARLDVCLHEALANVLAHGGKTALTADIVVEVRVGSDQHEGQAQLEVRDAGAPFDPLSSSPRSGAQSLRTVEPGGLGIVMIRRNSDLLEYKREHGLNCLSIGVRWQHSDG